MNLENGKAPMPRAGRPGPYVDRFCTITVKFRRGTVAVPGVTMVIGRTRVPTSGLETVIGKTPTPWAGRTQPLPKSAQIPSSENPVHFGFPFARKHYFTRLERINRLNQERTNRPECKIQKDRKGHVRDVSGRAVHYYAVDCHAFAVVGFHQADLVSPSLSPLAIGMLSCHFVSVSVRST